MARWSKRLLCIAFSFMFVFMAIGYAELVDTLEINGISNLTEPQGLYISHIEVVGNEGNTTAVDQTALLYTDVLSTINVGDYNAGGWVYKDGRWQWVEATINTVTYKITVKNNTRYKYAYRGIVYEASLNDNGYLQNGNALTIVTKDNQTDSSATFDKNDVVNPGDTKVFYATYTMGQDLHNTEFTTFVNYQFGIHVDSLGDYAAEKIIKKFKEVLNTQSSYQDLITHIDDKYVNQGWQSNYIGNVVGSTSNDTETIERLFGDELVLKIDGQEAKVTVMIKRTDVDDNPNTGDNFTAVNGNNSYTGNGCEMTLYITTNDLDKEIEAGEYAGDRGWADVYVAVFTCDKKSDGTYSDWYHIGGIYDGIAPMVSYDGSTNGTGSFITDDWTPLQTTYQVTKNYSYTVPAGDGRNDGREDIRDIMAMKDLAAVNEFNILLAEARRAVKYIDDNADYFQHEVFQEYIEALRKDVETANAMTVNANTRIVEIVQIMQKLENSTYPFLSYIS